MPDGLIQVLVIAFFIIISMMDGAARKKRKEAQRRSAEQGLPGAGPEPSDGEEAPEGLVPAELGEEIAALARGGPPPGTRRLPPTREPGPHDPPGHPSQPAERPSRPEPSPSPSPGVTGSWDGDPPVLTTEASASVSEHRAVRPPRSAPTRPVAVVKAESRYAVEPAARPIPASSEEGYLDRLLREETEGVAEATQASKARSRQPRSRDPLAGLRRGSDASLREAIVLSEVLGPPVSMRGSPHEPPG